jgi:5,10-methylenetetrahydrofolate reductase
VFKYLAEHYPKAWRMIGATVAPVEHVVKKPIWGCQMCGQCVLHNTGLTCPMGCPKNMRNGPCGGVGPEGQCEVKPQMRCVWVKAHERDARSPWKGRVRLINPPVNWALKGTSAWMNFFSGKDQHAATVAPVFRDPALTPRLRTASVTDVPKSDSRFERLLRDGKKWVLIGEMNPPDGVELDGFKRVGRSLSRIVDVVSVTEHPSARNHMSSLPASAALEAVGVETIATFTCRDRNRIAMQGDLLGAAALGVKNVLLVTGNHMVVGDHPEAKPVFDLESVNLIRLAKRLRDEGTYASGRALDSRPRLFLGGAAGPFAPPRGDRPTRTVKKLTAGADFIVTQHVFEPEVFRAYVEQLQRLHDGEIFLLGAVAVLPSVEVTHRLNRVLTGFRIPEAIVRRIEQAKNPQYAGIDVAAEIIQQMREIPGVRGNLIAALASGTHVMGSTQDEEVEVTEEVVRMAGLPLPEAETDARSGTAH